MFKEKHDRTKPVFQNDHLRMGGTNAQAESPISRLYYGPGQKWRPELGRGGRGRGGGLL